MRSTIRSSATPRLIATAIAQATFIGTASDLRFLAISRPSIEMLSPVSAVTKILAAAFSLEHFRTVIPDAWSRLASLSSP